MGFELYFQQALPWKSGNIIFDQPKLFKLANMMSFTWNFLKQISPGKPYVATPFPSMWAVFRWTTWLLFLTDFFTLEYFNRTSQKSLFCSDTCTDSLNTHASKQCQDMLPKETSERDFWPEDICIGAAGQKLREGSGDTLPCSTAPAVRTGRVEQQGRKMSPALCQQCIYSAISFSQVGILIFLNLLSPSPHCF